MNRWLPNITVVIGFAGGIALAGFIPVAPAHAAPQDCKTSCQCQSKCEEELQTCVEKCHKGSADKRTKCTIDCNNGLLECVEECPNPDCDCGGD